MLNKIPIENYILFNFSVSQKSVKVRGRTKSDCIRTSRFKVNRSEYARTKSDRNKLSRSASKRMTYIVSLHTGVLHVRKKTVILY